MWVDVTWGAGGSTADKTMELCINALKYHGLDVMMHLTCTNMEKEKLLEAPRRVSTPASGSRWKAASPTLPTS